MPNGTPKVAVLLIANNCAKWQYMAMSAQKIESVFGERLKKMRKQKGLRQVDLAEMLSVSKDTITRWENNLREPRASELEKIANILDTTVGYLLGGNQRTYTDETMYMSREHCLSETSDPAPLTTQKGESGDPPTPYEHAPPAKDPYESNIGEIYYPKGGFLKIPLIDMDVCAGKGWNTEFMDSQIISQEMVPAEWVGKINPEWPPFMVPIKGDSMEAAGLTEGFYAIINPAVDVYSGDSAMVRYGENKSTALKRVYYLPGGAIELRSASPGYPVITYSRDQQMSECDGLDIIGRVMGIYGRPKRG
jgi:transcriptional regulator with XRE-family HTH domain